MDIERIRSIFENRTPGVIGKHRFYSVLVPFVCCSEGFDEEDRNHSAGETDALHDGGDLSLLYEVRASGIMQPGEVCFPGGHVESGESEVDCAVRETCEELGVSEDSIKIFGKGDVIHGTGFTLSTVIGYIDLKRQKRKAEADDTGSAEGLLSGLTPDRREVSEVFTVPLSKILSTEPDHYEEKMAPVIDKSFPYDKVGIDKDYPWRTTEHDIPVYDIGGRIIWGLTARITERVAEILKNS